MKIFCKKKSWHGYAQQVVTTDSEPSRKERQGHRHHDCEEKRPQIHRWAGIRNTWAHIKCPEVVRGPARIQENAADQESGKDEEQIDAAPAPAKALKNGAARSLAVRAGVPNEWQRSIHHQDCQTAQTIQFGDPRCHFARSGWSGHMRSTKPLRYRFPSPSPRITAPLIVSLTHSEFQRSFPNVLTFQRSNVLTLQILHQPAELTAALLALILQLLHLPCCQISRVARDVELCPQFSSRPLGPAQNSKNRPFVLLSKPSATLDMIETAARRI